MAAHSTRYRVRVNTRYCVRASIAEKAAAMRWAKPPEAMRAGGLPAAQPLEGEILPPSPFAKFRGQIDLGGNPIDVYVLDTGDRVISMRGAVKAITGQDAGNLVEYLSVQGLKDFIDKDLALVESKEFHIPGTQFDAPAFLQAGKFGIDPFGGRQVEAGDHARRGVRRLLAIHSS